MRSIMVLSLAFAIAASAAANAAQYDVTIDGPDAIYLAGRTDITIPPYGQIWSGGLARHPITPEQAQESFPPWIPVAGGQTVRVLDPASGGINYFNGLGPPYFGPDGNPGGSNLNAFGGISAYSAPFQGALAGVFLDDNIPNGTPPAAINFFALGGDFLTLSPLIGQVFYIGNGQTSSNVFQEFIAPEGATRLFFGIPDGFGFNGTPGAYDDNDGAYRIRVAVDEIPNNNPIGETPLPGALLLMGSVLAGGASVGAWRKRRKKAA